MQELAELLQSNFFRRVIGIHAVYDHKMESGNDCPPAPQAEKLPSGKSAFG